jgi:hypothetical protein
MNLENYMLGEISQAWRSKYHLICVESKKAELLEAQSRTVVSRDLVEGMEKGDVLAKEYKIAVRKEKQVLNIYCKTQ